MRKLTCAVALLVAALVFGSGNAHAAFSWQRIDVNPFAASRNAAMAERPVVFHDKFGLSAACTEAAYRAMTHVAKLEHLYWGEKFKYMMSRDAVVRQDVVVDIDSSVLAGSAGLMEVWQFDCGGYQYKIGLPQLCHNWVLFVPTRIKVCPEVYTLKVNDLPNSAMQLPGVAETAKREAHTDRFDDYPSTPHVSQKHGMMFLRMLKNGTLHRSQRRRLIRLSFIMTHQAQGGAVDIWKEKVIGVFPFTGLYVLKITAAQRAQWDAERAVPVGWAPASPPDSGQTGEYELRFFNHLPENPELGEWANNPVPDCIMDEFFIERK